MTEDLKDGSGIPQEPKKQKSAHKDEGKMEIYDWLQCIVVAIVAGILIFMFGIRVVNVKGHSMEPTLLDTDMILTSNLFYTPKNGDVVVLQTDSYGPEPLVKRIIATGGQTVDIDFDAGIVYVDGVALDEPYTAEPTTTREDFEGPVEVPEGFLFLMGDNRNRSTDSRTDSIGFVDQRCVIGKVLIVLYPAASDYSERDYDRIGSIY